MKQLNPLYTIQNIRAAYQAKKALRRIEKERKRELRRIRDEALHARYVEDLCNSITPYEELEPHELIKINAHKERHMPWIEIKIKGNTTMRIYHYESDQKSTSTDSDLQALEDLENEFLADSEFTAACDNDILEMDDGNDDDDDYTSTDDATDDVESEYDHEMQELEDWYDREGHYAMEAFKHFMDSQE